MAAPWVLAGRCEERQRISSLELVVAIYHLSVKHASRAQGLSALAHAHYITRQGRYAQGLYREDFVHAEHAHMPRWAHDDGQVFWDAADTYERANGRFYTEIEIALPRELEPAQQLTVVREFVTVQVGDTHPCTWALHNRPALDGGMNPHAHIMLSERTLDGIERDASVFFRRANPDYPERGGAAKDPAWNERDKVQLLREAWSETANAALERAGLAVRIDHRSLEAQGIDRAPEPKLGPEQTVMLRRGFLTEDAERVLELRDGRAQIASLAHDLAEAQTRMVEPEPREPTRDASAQERTPSPEPERPLSDVEAHGIDRAPEPDIPAPAFDMPERTRAPAIPRVEAEPAALEPTRELVAAEPDVPDPVPDLSPEPAGFWGRLVERVRGWLPWNWGTRIETPALREREATPEPEHPSALTLAPPAGPGLDLERAPDLTPPLQRTETLSEPPRESPPREVLEPPLPEDPVQRVLESIERLRQEREQAQGLAPGSTPRETPEETLERVLAQQRETPEETFQRLRAQQQDRAEQAFQNMLARRDRQLEADRIDLERTTGVPHTLATTPEVRGRVIDRVELAGTPFARIAQEDGYVLVPWQSDMAQHRGHTVTLELSGQGTLSRVLRLLPDEDERHRGRALHPDLFPPEEERERRRSGPDRDLDL